MCVSDAHTMYLMGAPELHRTITARKPCVADVLCNWEINSRADLKVTMEPNLRFPAVFCENLRFSAKIYGFLRFPAPSKCLNFQEKG